MPRTDKAFRVVAAPLDRVYTALVDPDALIVPPIGGIGPWSRNYLRNPGVNNHDVTFNKNFPFGRDGKQYVQLRFEVFNVFNHTQFKGINISTNLVAPLELTNRDVFQSYDRALVTDNLRSQQRPDRPVKAYGQYFGEYNSAREPRIIQIGLKVYF